MHFLKSRNQDSESRNCIFESFLFRKILFRKRGYNVLESEGYNLYMTVKQAAEK